MGNVKLTLSNVQARTLLYAMQDYVDTSEDPSVCRWAQQLRKKLLDAGVGFANASHRDAVALAPPERVDPYSTPEGDARADREEEP